MSFSSKCHFFKLNVIFLSIKGYQSNVIPQAPPQAAPLVYQQNVQGGVFLHACLFVPMLTITSVSSLSGSSLSHFIKFSSPIYVSSHFSTLCQVKFF